MAQAIEHQNLLVRTILSKYMGMISSINILTKKALEKK